MENARITSTPYDDVFRTLLNDCSPLIIPVINEMFGEHYSGQEKIIFSPNEHFLNQLGGNEDERITDTSFKIEGKEAKKYHLEYQSSTDNSMLVRFFKYRRTKPAFAYSNPQFIFLPHFLFLLPVFSKYRANIPHICCLNPFCLKLHADFLLF